MNKRTPVGYQWIHHFVIICSCVALLLAIGLSCTSIHTSLPTQTTPNVTKPIKMATTTPIIAMTESSVASEWITYTATERCGFTISYPAAIEVTDNGAHSQSFSYKLTVPGRGAQSFIYISVIDQESQGLDEEIIYNYDPAETKILQALEVGEYKPIRDIADVSAWFTYQRLPDTAIDGHPALVYENVQPWEFLSGTKEVRYLLSLHGCTYLIGGYLFIINTNLPGIITEQLFNQVIATIQLNP